MNIQRLHSAQLLLLLPRHLCLYAVIARSAVGVGIPMGMGVGWGDGVRSTLRTAAVLIAVTIALPVNRLAATPGPFRSVLQPSSIPWQRRLL